MLINIYDSVEACLCIHLLARLTVRNVQLIINKKGNKGNLLCPCFYKVISLERL